MQGIFGASLRDAAVMQHYQCVKCGFIGTLKLLTCSTKAENAKASLFSVAKLAWNNYLTALEATELLPNCLGGYITAWNNSASNLQGCPSV